MNITPEEPLYRTYAKAMLSIDKLPDSLEEKLSLAEGMVKKVKPYGWLSSTQNIATIIMIWEFEQLMQKFTED